MSHTLTVETRYEHVWTGQPDTVNAAVGDRLRRLRSQGFKPKVATLTDGAVLITWVAGPGEHVNLTYTEEPSNE